jgi:hypothetical protein
MGRGRALFAPAFFISALATITQLCRKTPAAFVPCSLRFRLCKRTNLLSISASEIKL